MRIRLADEVDAAAVRDIYAPVVENTVISFEDTPPSEGEMADRIADARPRYPWLVCEIEDEIAGYAYAGQHRSRGAYRWSVDVSVYVAEERRRTGVGRGLYESLLELLRLQGFYNAYAGIALPNEASVSLHESLGFERVGVYESVGYKDGAWRDVGWWQLKLRDRDAETPDQPRSVDEIGDSERRATLASGEEHVRI
jgi:phosphinothricin acetyltransferase